MKAIRVHQFGDPGVLRCEDVRDPAPAAGQVLVRAKAVGVNPVETYIRAGWYGPKDFPYTPGADAAGVVESVGEGVTRFKPGDRVYTAGTLSGAYAELVLCDARAVHPLPANVTFQQGAALGVPYATAYRALHVRGQALPGETVLVHGASGGVGTAAVQLARAHGCRVFGTAGTEQGLLLVTEQGAHEVFDHKSPDYTQRVLESTAGAGVDLVLEMLANVNLDKDLKLLAKRGRIVVIGSRGRIEIDPRDTMARDADIRGMSLVHADDRELASIHAALTAGLENATLRPVVGKQLPLSDAPQAHREVMESPHHGKVILIP